MRRWTGWVLEAAGWFAACWGIWLLSLSAITGQDLVVSAAGSIPCGVLAVIGRGAARSAWTFRPQWLRPVAKLPMAIVGDSVQVITRAASRSRPRGTLTKQRISSVSGDSAESAAHRALTALLICMTPSTIVVDFDEQSGEALIHSLRARGMNIAEEVAG